MSYVAENLMPGETVVHEARLHWIIFAWPVLLVLFGFLFFSGGSETGGIAWFLIIVGLAVGAFAAINFSTSEFAVTNKRVLIKVGWLSRRSLETLLSKVEGIGVEQDISGRILDYGTIVVTGTGGTPERFKRIGEPLTFRQQVQIQIAAIEDRGGSRAVAPATVAPGREERECPYCAEIILAKAKVCKHCGRDLQPA